jgi:hypothetical protein
MRSGSVRPKPKPPAGHATPIIGPQRASLRAHRHGSTSSRTWQKTYRLTLPSVSPERRPRPSSRTLASAPTDQAVRGHGWPWLRESGAHRHGSTSSRTWQKTYRLTLPSGLMLLARGIAAIARIAHRGRRVGRREDGERGGPPPARQLMPPARRLRLETVASVAAIPRPLTTRPCRGRRAPWPSCSARRP